MKLRNYLMEINMDNLSKKLNDILGVTGNPAEKWGTDYKKNFLYIANLNSEADAKSVLKLVSEKIKGNWKIIKPNDMDKIIKGDMGNSDIKTDKFHVILYK